MDRQFVQKKKKTKENVHFKTDKVLSFFFPLDCEQHSSNTFKEWDYKPLNQNIGPF